jgi:hypothetical protein
MKVTVEFTDEYQGEATRVFDGATKVYTGAENYFVTTPVNTWLFRYSEVRKLTVEEQ